MTKTAIEWSEFVWNPIVGCSVVSPGCTNCYAMKDAYRKGFNPKVPQYHGLTKMTKGGAVWTGKVRLHEPALLAPLKRRKPTTYFVNSMSDLFHEDISNDWIDLIFAVMALSPQHIFQVLTKRSARMRAYIDGITSRPRAESVAYRGVHLWGGRDPDAVYDTVMDIIAEAPLPNVWLGVSTEDQERANQRIPDLLATPAALRFTSAEPLLGPLDLRKIELRRHGALPTWHSQRLGDYVQPLTGNFRDSPRINWVIVGGESGHGARPMHPDWARSLRDQCAAAGVPFFFKQWGEFLSLDQLSGGGWAYTRTCGEDRLGRVTTGGFEDPHPAFGGRDIPAVYPWRDGSGGPGAGPCMLRVGKKLAGALLDGREHHEMPEVRRG